MSPEQDPSPAGPSYNKHALEVASGATGESEAFQTPLFNDMVEEHGNVTSITQATGVTPDVRARLEALLVRLERWGKIGQECTTEISGILQGPSAASEVVHSRLPETTIPRIRTAAWREFHRSYDGKQPQCTIDVLGDETPSAPDESGGLHSLQVPERLRINSARVIYTVRKNFFAVETEYSNPTTRPLVILRPFKQLVYYETHMKSLLNKLETALDATSSLTGTADFDTFMSRFKILKDHKTPLNLWSFEDFVLYTKELRCVANFMDNFIQPARRRLKTETDMVSFSELWFLFPECSHIFAKGFGIAQKVWRIIQRTGGRREMNPKQGRLPTPRYDRFIIDCYFIDYNGSRFFPVYGRFEIEPFEGRKAVTSLPVVPIRVATKDGLVDYDAISQRGELFVQYCTKTCHFYYNGWSHHRDPRGMSLRRHLNTKIDSEVILDFTRAVAEDPSPDGLDESEPAIYRISHGDLGEEDFEFDNDSTWDKVLSDEVISNLRVPGRQGDLDGCRDCLPIFPDRVLGYVLRTRTWGRHRLYLRHP